jgi:biotin-(acetyl-CoA carboxylase) ligase
MENYFEKIIESINALNSREDMDAFHKNFQKVYDAWGVRQKKINTLQAQLFNVGDRVTFKDRKGITVEGVVEKVKIKNILVLADTDEKWDIPASFLTKQNKEVA